MKFDRILSVPGAYNIRDLGGYPGTDGSTRWRSILRADSLHRLDGPAMDQLHAMGLTTVIDLRHAAEHARFPNPFADHPAVIYLQIPLFESLRIPHDIPEDQVLRTLYTQALDKRHDAIARTLTAIAEAPDGAVMFHCTAGKDRTGLIAALLLALGGVDAETIATDYAMTRELLEPIIDGLQAHVLEQGTDPAIAAAVLGSDPQSMLHLLAHLDATYGGIHPYLDRIGLTPATVDALCARIIDMEATA